MNRLLSRYRPRFIRSLVYMLQASEYNVREYLAWYHRAPDFAHVEKRKHLVKTPKAIALLAISWVFVVAWAAALMSYANYTHSDVPIVVLAGVVVLTPFYFPYILASVVLAGQSLQKPVEWWVMKKTREKLARHTGTKIAIAGSYGKTSMREIVKTILAQGKKVAAAPGSYNTPLGIASFVKSLKGDEEILIFELGEYYPGDIRKLCEMVRPSIGIITGVNEAHLEKFGTIEKTAATIFELADWLGEKPLYVNADNEITRRYSKAAYIRYSQTGAGDWILDGARTGLDGTSFALHAGDGVIRVKTTLLGLHMLGSLAAAAHLARALGLSNDQIERGIASTVAFEHRMQPHTDGAGVTTIDDSYNGNPDGMKAGIEFLGSLVGHRRFYVTPGLVEVGKRNESVHREIGRQLAGAGIEKVVLMRNSATPYIERGLNEHDFAGEILWFEDMPAALKALQHMTVSGDVVMIQNDWPDQYF